MWATDLTTFTSAQQLSHNISYLPYSFVSLKNKANLYHQQHLVTSICDLIAPDKGS